MFLTINSLKYHHLHRIKKRLEKPLYFAYPFHDTSVSYGQVQRAFTEGIKSTEQRQHDKPEFLCIYLKPELKNAFKCFIRIFFSVLATKQAELVPKRDVESDLYEFDFARFTYTSNLSHLLIFECLI